MVLDKKMIVIQTINIVLCYKIKFNDTGDILKFNHKLIKNENTKINSVKKENQVFFTSTF